MRSAPEVDANGSVPNRMVTNSEIEPRDPWDMTLAVKAITRVMLPHSWPWEPLDCQKHTLIGMLIGIL